jgi:hypothetical protein
LTAANLCATPDGSRIAARDASSMITSQHTHRTGDARFFILLTAAHAAVAFPALGVWAAICERTKRR